MSHVRFPEHRAPVTSYAFEPSGWRPGIVCRLPLLLALVVGLLLAGAPPATRVRARSATAQAAGAEIAATSEQRTSRYFDAIRDQPLLLQAFLRQMPKGGDIHSHLSGAVYAESLIRFAADQGLCVDRVSFVLSNAPCSAADRPAVADSLRDNTLYNGMIDAWSMRSFQPTLESGHDHFFNTFGKFAAATGASTGHMLAEVASRAAAQHELYLELMHTADGSASADLGATLGWNPDLGAMHDQLEAAGIRQIVDQTRQDLDQSEAQMRADLRCGQADADAGCAVTVRYLYQAIRNQPPERVFAQFVLAFDLIHADPRVVGLNLVAPEDDYISIRDYTLQMSMLDYLFQRAPDTNISLHAGEFSPSLVPPAEQRFHIRQAIELGHARRIGHGVDVMQEDDPFDLLAEMAERKILVEICLLSNDQILLVTGSNHPFPIYLHFGVPVTLATDDEGVERTDLSRQYQLAVSTHGLGYEDLKRLSRESLEHSFLPGDSLWQPGDHFSPASACAIDLPAMGEITAPCRRLLDSSERARLEWKLEQAYAAFEQGF